MPKDVYYPRVLMLGQNLNVVKGGITLTNLFKGWPKEKLAVAISKKEFINLDVCERYYRLGFLEDYWVWPFSYVKRTDKVSGPVKLTGMKVGDFLENKNFKQTFSKSWFYTIISLLGTHDLMRRLRVSHQLLAWVKDFSPDLIYSQVSTLSMIRFVYDVSQMMKLPLIIHQMDDWPSTIYRKGLLSPYMRWRTDIELRRLFAKSTTLGISQAMSDEYRDRYGKEFIPFHNPVDLDIWIKNSKKTWEAGFPFKVRYGGRIGTAIEESVIDIAEAIEEINQYGMPVTFDLYIDLTKNEFLNKITKYKFTKAYPKLPYEQVPGSMAAADLLVLPNDFDRQSVHFIQYSMSTKVSEYMASGTPILVYAPEETAVVKYARREKWGSVVSRRDKTLLKQMIIQLMQTPDLRETIGKQAQKLASQNHDAVLVREQFRQVLAGAVKAK